MTQHSHHCQRLLACLLVTSIATGAHSAEIILREKATLSGPVVRLGDVADISAQTDSRMHDLATTPLMPAPAPGTMQFLRSVEIRDLLVSRGVLLDGVTIRGAKLVAIGNRKSIAKKKALSTDTRRYLPLKRREQIQDAVKRAIVLYLRKQTLHEQTQPQSDWNLKLRLDDKQLHRLDQPGLQLTAHGGNSPWTGKQMFRLAGKNTDAGVAVIAFVEQAMPAVVAIRPIDRGSLIRASDVEIRSQNGRVPSQAFDSLDRVVGMVAQRTIRPESVLLRSHVKAPLQVERGETVTVFARTAGIQVRTFAIAKQDGSMGDLIQVETADKRERYDARVVGRRELEVFATGASVAEHTTLGPRNTKLR